MKFRVTIPSMEGSVPFPALLERARGGDRAALDDLAQRIAGLLANYDFASDAALSYFRNRLVEAPRDVAFGLNYVLGHADTLEKQDAAAAALTFKTDVLWAQLDAIEHAYVTPGRIPAGAWNGSDGLLVANKGERRAG